MQRNTTKQDVSSMAFPTLRAASCVWLRIGFLSFGGPAGQIALMHREVVEKRRWISNERFLHALNFCSLLPGPEAQQLATYLGWLLHGAKGGFVAGLFFIVPGALVMLGLSLLFALAGQVSAVAALFVGLKAAVLVIVFDALLRIAARALHGALSWALAGLAFAALFLCNIPFPLVVLSAALIGAMLPRSFATTDTAATGQDAPALLDSLMASRPDYAVQRAKGARLAGGLALVAWVVPLAVLLPSGGLYAEVAQFFSKMAVVTFGGAYAVLTYVAQEAVEGYGWLTATQMLSGLGLAETTPGPLILVLEFVGFLAGFGAADNPDAALVSGIASAALTLWVTFAPCFAFVFLGAPLIESLRKKRALRAALSAIRAAAVGVIANLALWFGLRVLFLKLQPLQLGPLTLQLPLLTSIDPVVVCIVIIATLALFVFRAGLIGTLALCALAGLALKLGAGL